MDDLKNVLPINLIRLIEDRPDSSKLQEIRLKCNKPVMLNIDNREVILNYTTSQNEINNIFNKISNFSVYAFEEDIKQGFITIRGGHRIGVTGHWVNDDGVIKSLKSVFSINIRIAREIIGCSNSLLPHVAKGDKVYNTILVSPPKCGKTTLLRDLVRNISNGNLKYNITGKKVCVIDERSEIAACHMGIPQMDVGVRTDIYDNCLKYVGLMMAIRCMSPEVIVCDEIGTDRDVEAIVSAFNCGVNIISTIHGNNEDDLYSRPVFKKLIENKVIEKIIVLSNKNGVGTIDKIVDINSDRQVINVG
ncbi:stage III sporulation protein AA [Clostridium folliculivorans]|uniref:Stage III sporulation protein AA n=1 Tax=Clostridium folliculivorans TaxID=2886038 RepID=A0A9W6D9U2_9CLOT|nr:stage III sporulation protein AA [Clostridium folliculivorans]GKU23988.1 stage III sporulation protein AA [Clostridium folliculivorans]GKU30103.1 stage III sporulation protein AA [Clostridium folliculivorans]